jgi:hypothetical protein
MEQWYPLAGTLERWRVGTRASKFREIPSWIERSRGLAWSSDRMPLYRRWYAS